MAPREPSFSPTRAVGVQPLVLLVVDEPGTQRLLVSALASHGLRCLRTAAQDDAIIQALRHQPHLVLLDAGHGGIDAVDLMARLREWTSAPIIALLARSQSHEKAGLLDAGANDCIVKPVGPVELVARMHVWLRAKTRRRTYEPRAERLRIDRERRALFVDGREIHLTPIEYKVLLALARRPGVPMTEAQLLASVWGKGSTTRAQLLHAHVRRLKQKIERDPARPTRLLTEIDGGYWLKRARWTTG